MIRRSVPIQRLELVNKLKIVKPRFNPSDDASLNELKGALKTGVMELFNNKSNVSKIGRADLITLADKIVRVLENVSPALLHTTLEPLIQDEEHGLKRSQVSKARPRVIKEKSNKAKRPLTDYMKFSQAQRKTDEIKALAPKDRMARIGELWGERSEDMEKTPPPIPSNTPLPPAEGEFFEISSSEDESSPKKDSPPASAAKPARLRNKGTKTKRATKNNSASKSKGGPKKGASKPKTNEVNTRPKRKRNKPQMLVRGQGMQMEGGKWQDYIPPEVKSMAMKQARKFTGKSIASDDLFGSGMYRD